MSKVNKVLAICLCLLSCVFMTACPSWTVTLMNQVVTGTVGAINLAAAINHTTPDQALITKIQTEGNTFISAYQDWEAATPNMKPGAWAKVQEAMTIVQKDLPAVLQGFNIKDPTYLAVADFVISEIQSISITIQGTSQMAATSKGAVKASDVTSAKNFKSEYNKKMKAAGHPEFAIK